MTDITELAQSLKAAAPNVTSGPWVVKDYFWLTPESEVFSGEFVECHNGPDAQYLKLLSPENILTLVEALEKAQSARDEYEAGERSAAVKSVALQDEIYRLNARIAELETRTVNPATYSENADADHCRKWAWQQVKGEVSTEEWTTGDNITYFGFFCWGWDMRRQYNEQRPVTVKLTDISEFLAEVHDKTLALAFRRLAEGVREADIYAMRAAGIKWEGE